MLYTFKMFVVSMIAIAVLLVVMYLFKQLMKKYSMMILILSILFSIFCILNHYNNFSTILSSSSDIGFIVLFIINILLSVLPSIIIVITYFKTRTKNEIIKEYDKMRIQDL